MATAGDMDLSQDLKERGDWDDLRRDSRVAVRKGTAWTKAGRLEVWTQQGFSWGGGCGLLT